ncbi:MAG: HAMP domain-containing histidine kinase [Acetatifactor sp.]|nr:HAMP domain-containing histidine kinase [Acetatifactor sp.]
MKAWRKIFVVVMVLTAVIFAGVNLFLYYLKTPENGRPYRVEVNRIALQIEEGGPESVDLSLYQYVKAVAEFGDAFYESDSDYMIREIDGRLYRFDYTVKNDIGNSQIVIAVNMILTVMTAVVFGVLFYVRGKILKPFERLTNVPYELSRGNLTLPVKESKSRFFGKFLWGIDLLRENIEQQKQRELELQRERKTLLLSLSHDIKTPLSTIKLYSKALSKNLYSDGEKQREIAESINEKADEIEGYVSRIITASREDFLSLDVENGEFYLSDLVQNIAAYYGEKLALVKTEFIVEKYNNCLLFGDLDRSVEVVQNIIENALKYGDGKQIEVLFPDEEEGVLISVRNSGCTLDKEDLPHIFESFWRGANSQNVSGSGLGLYICRQLMHKMNGEVFAEIDGDGIAVTAVFGRA